MTAYQHIYEGAGAPATAPAAVGAHYIDTTGKRQYLAVGTASAADWVLQPLAIQSSAVDGSGHLIVTYTDASTADLGLVKGSDGADGRGITSAVIDVSGHLIVTYTDASTADMGLVVGADGTNGVGVQSVAVDGNKHLIITLTDASTIDAGLLPAGAGLEVGDVLFTMRAPGAGWVAPGVYLQSAYPALFAALGLLGGNPSLGAKESWEKSHIDTSALSVSAIDAAGSTVIACYQSFIWRSTNTGDSYTKTSDTGTVNKAIATDGSGNWLRVGGDSGGTSAICRGSSDDGVTWADVAHGLGAVQMLQAAAFSDGVWIIGGTNGKLSRSVNGLAGPFTEVASNVGANAILGIACDGAGTWVAVGVGGFGARSTDNGLTWTALTMNASAQNLAAVAVTGTGGTATWVAGGISGTVVKSTDGGATWAADATTGINALNSVYGIATNGSGVIIISAADEWSYSADSGATWAIQAFHATQNASGNSIVYDAVNGNWVAAGSAYDSGYDDDCATFRRSLGQYPYDTATHFSIPPITAPAGTTAYVKAIT